MIPPLDVAFELISIVVDLAQVARRITSGFVVEVRRRGTAALAAGGDGSGAHTFSEFDDGDEAVAARTEIKLGSHLETQLNATRI